MQQNNLTGKSYIIFFLFSLFSLFSSDAHCNDERFIIYIHDPAKHTIRFFWRDDHSAPYRSIGNLKTYLEKHSQTLLFAMNGGMYQEDQSPLGLYVENGRTLKRLNTSTGNGNFYLQPNGVFYITMQGKAGICATTSYSRNEKVKYATQSGPMLINNGQIHPAFKKGSSNVNIRNGVGILPDGKIIFVLSKKEINLYDFAMYFKSMGCLNALYLDGFVSRMFLPEKNWNQTDGNFGVIIAVTR